MKNEAVERLVEYGIKPSIQRISILEFLMSNPIHPTVDVVYSSLVGDIPTLSKTTVYNTLKMLAESGVIASLTIDEKNIRYDADIKDHAHFICRTCSKVYDLEIENFDKIKVLNSENLKITNGTIYFRGFCENCQS